MNLARETSGTTSQTGVYLKATRADTSTTSLDTECTAQARCLHTRDGDGKLTRALWIPSRNRCQGKIMEVNRERGATTSEKTPPERQPAFSSGRTAVTESRALRTVSAAQRHVPPETQSSEDSTLGYAGSCSRSVLCPSKHTPGGQKPPCR